MRREEGEEIVDIAICIIAFAVAFCATILFLLPGIILFGLFAHFFTRYMLDRANDDKFWKEIK